MSHETPWKISSHRENLDSEENLYIFSHERKIENSDSLLGCNIENKYKENKAHDTYHKNKVV